MRPSVLAGACLALGLTSAACTAAAPPDASLDGSRVDASLDGSLGACSAAGVRCAGNRALRCDAAGAEPVVTDCAGATPACSPGLGCTACRAGASACSAADPFALERCAADGSRVESTERCADPLLPVCVGGQCANPCRDGTAQPGSLGCEFWSVTTGNYVDALFSFAVVVSNPQSYPVRVSVTGGAASAPLERTVPANSLETLTLPWVPSLSLNGRTNPSESVLARAGAYRVQATAPVAAYQFNPLEYQRSMRLSQSNDASLLLPTMALSGHYLVTTYASSRPSPFVAVVGTAAGATTVTVTPTSNVAAGAGLPTCSAGATCTYSLAQGDVLQLMSERLSNPDGTPGTTELSGTLLSADRPVAVFAGHFCAYIPANNGFCDHLEEQLFPLETWGTQALVTPFADRPDVPSLLRVTAHRAGTTVSFEPASTHAPVTLGAGQFLELESTSAFQVRGTGALSVAQYMSGERPRMVESSGSPAMVLLPPAEQFRSEYTILVPSTYVRNFVNVVAPTDATVRLDGAAVTAAAIPLGASGWSYRALEVEPGTHRFDTGGSAATLGLTVYGVAPNTSYAYPGGIDLAPINPPL